MGQALRGRSELHQVLPDNSWDWK